MTKRQLEKVRTKFENLDLSRYHILTYDEMLKVNGGGSVSDDSSESESSETTSASENLDFSDLGSVTENGSGTAAETVSESVAESGGHEIENSNEAIANAEVGDTLTRNDGTEVTITQGDIDWAQDYCDAHGIDWSRSGEEEAKANDGAKGGGQAASAENQTELENYDYDSGSSSSIKETESDYITDEKAGRETKNEVSGNSAKDSTPDKGGKGATEISSSRKNGNDCPDYVERCRMRDEMIAAKRNSELNNAPKNEEYSRTKNIAVGLGELLLGTFCFVGATASAAEIEAMTSGAASYYAGMAVVEGYAAGSTLFAFGITRLTDSYNSNFADDIKSAFVPMEVDVNKSISDAAK